MYVGIPHQLGRRVYYHTNIFVDYFCCVAAFLWKHGGNLPPWKALLFFAIANGVVMTVGWLCWLWYHGVGFSYPY